MTPLVDLALVFLLSLGPLLLLFALFEL